MGFMAQAAKDAKVKRLNKVNESIKSSINVTKLVKEMKEMLLARQYRTFNRTINTEYGPNLLDWVGEVASHQARLADIRLIVTDRRFYLEELITTARKHLLSGYPDLKGTVTDKKAMVDTVLDEPISTLARLERLIKISDICDKELERSYYNAQLVKSVVELSTRQDRSG